MSGQQRCVSDCTGNLFTRECIHFTLMAFATIIVLLFAMVQLIQLSSFQSIYTGYYFGMISTVLSFWQTPPKIPKRNAELPPTSSSLEMGSSP